MSSGEIAQEEVSLSTVMSSPSGAEDCSMSMLDQSHLQPLAVHGCNNPTNAMIPTEPTIPEGIILSASNYVMKSPLGAPVALGHTRTRLK